MYVRSVHLYISNIYTTCFCFCLASVRKIFTIVPVSEHRHFLQCVKLWSTYTYVCVLWLYRCTYIYRYICLHARACTHQVLIERFALLLPQMCWTFTLFRCENRASQARERLFISEGIALTMTRQDFVVCTLTTSQYIEMLRQYVTRMVRVF